MRGKVAEAAEVVAVEIKLPKFRISIQMHFFFHPKETQPFRNCALSTCWKYRSSFVSSYLSFKLGWWSKSSFRQVVIQTSIQQVKCEKSQKINKSMLIFQRMHDRRAFWPNIFWCHIKNSFLKWKTFLHSVKGHEIKPLNKFQGQHEASLWNAAQRPTVVLVRQLLSLCSIVADTNMRAISPT